MDGCADKTGGFGNQLSFKDCVTYINHGFGRSTDVLLQGQDQLRWQRWLANRQLGRLVFVFRRVDTAMEIGNGLRHAALSCCSSVLSAAS